jgi:hypothetical protein
VFVVEGHSKDRLIKLAKDTNAKIAVFALDDNDRRITAQRSISELASERPATH